MDGPRLFLLMVMLMPVGIFILGMLFIWLFDWLRSD